MSVMTLPRTLADQNRKLAVITDPVEDIGNIPADVLNDAIEASCRATQENTRFAPSGSETFQDNAVCEDSGSSTLGASAWEATMGAFRFFDEDEPGQADPEGDQLYQALKKKGTTVTVVERHVNKRWREPWAAGDEYRAFRVEADDWVPASEQHTGYIKGHFPMAVKSADQNGEVAEATGEGGSGND